MRGDVAGVGCRYNRLLVPTGMTGNKEVTGDAGAVYPSVDPDAKNNGFQQQGSERGFLGTDMVPVGATRAYRVSIRGGGGAII